MVLTLLSSKELDDKLGIQLTSKSHGYRVESKITSNPKSSKQLALVVGFFWTFSQIVGSTEIRVLTAIALIFWKTDWKDISILW